MICSIFLFFAFISFVSSDFINVGEVLTRNTCEPKTGICSPCTFLKDCPVDQLSFMTNELCKVACKGIAKNASKDAAEDQKMNRTRRGAPMAMNATASVNKTETQLPKPGRERRAAAPPKATATNATEMGNLTSEGKGRSRRDIPLNGANMTTSNATDHKPKAGKVVVKREAKKVAAKDNSTIDSMANQTMPVGQKVKRAAGLKPLHANETMANSTEQEGHGRVARSASINVDRPVVNLDTAVLYMDNLTIVASKDGGESVGNDTTVLEMKDPEITITKPVVNLQKAILHIKDLKIISSTGSLDKDQDSEASQSRPARSATIAKFECDPKSKKCKKCVGKVCPEGSFDSMDLCAKSCLAGNSTVV